MRCEAATGLRNRRAKGGPLSEVTSFIIREEEGEEEEEEGGREGGREWEGVRG
jgi:hypothetical protein